MAMLGSSCGLWAARAFPQASMAPAKLLPQLLTEVSPVGRAGFLGAPEAPEVAVASTRTFTTMVALRGNTAEGAWAESWWQLWHCSERSAAAQGAACSGLWLSAVSSVAASWYKKPRLREMDLSARDDLSVNVWA